MMNALQLPTELATKATLLDLDRGLSLMMALPSKATESAKLAKESYWIAVEGCSRFGLEASVKAVLRAALGHKYFPSPVELKMQIDIAEKPIWDEQRRNISALESRQEQYRHESQEIKDRSISRWNDVSSGMKSPPQKGVSTQNPFELSNQRSDVARGICTANEKPVHLDKNDPRLDGLKDRNEPFGFTKPTWKAA